MKSNLVAISTLLLLLISLFGTAFKITLVTFGSPAESHKTGWELIALENPTGDSITGDFEISVSPSRVGVHIAGSADITYYCANPGAWPDYADWWEWLNGTATYAHHWDWMDWWATNGSLTNITYNDIKHWTNPDMYSDSGDVPYKTFMDNTYMADPNTTDVHDEPDIYPDLLPWVDNKVVLENQIITGNTTVWLVLKIVMTQSGVYTFNMTGPSGITITPSTWRMGGLATIIVPDEYPTIQEAIDVASPGDTINVAAGTYNEQVRFTKPVTVTSFTGEAVSGGVVINPNGTEFEGPVSGHMVRAAVTFEAGSNGSVLRGLTIENSYASDYMVGNQGGNSGIEVIDGGIDNVVVQNVNVNNVSGHGFGSYDSNHPWPPPSGWLIDNCKFSTTDTDTWSGMRPENMDNLTIQDCDVGPTNYGGILLINVNNAVVQRNKVHNTVRAGIQVDSYCTGAIDVLDNDVWDTNSAHQADYGDVRLYGQHVPDPHGDAAATVTIQRNLLHDGYNGLCVKTGQNISTRTVVIHKNNIFGHLNYGMLNTGIGTLDATYNWWGNETGPYHPTLNPDGLGDNVTGNVDFKPWLIQPYPPEVPVSELYVDPPLMEYWTPAYGSSFTINVKLANVSLLYGFQFNLTWNNTLLNLIEVEYVVLWSEYFEVRNDTSAGVYSVAATCMGEASPFNGSATLATLSFKTAYDPIYPENVNSSLALVDTLLGRSKNMTEVEPIPHLVYNGEYFCYSNQPKIAMSPHLCEMWKHQTLTTFNAGVNITDVVNLYAYEIELRYNTSFLDATEITVEPFFTSYRNPISVINDPQGLLIVRVEAISPAPPANGSGTLVTFTFKVTDSVVWDTSGPMLISNLNLTVKELVTHKNASIQADIIDGVYRYNPVPGDLNKDGIVNMADLRITAQAFDTEEGELGWDPRADLDRNGIVNILDIIIVARNFGRTKP